MQCQSLSSQHAFLWAPGLLTRVATASEARAHAATSSSPPSSSSSLSLNARGERDTSGLPAAPQDLVAPLAALLRVAAATVVQGVRDNDSSNALTWLHPTRTPVVPPEGALWRLFALAEKWRLHDLAVAEITSPPPPLLRATTASGTGARGGAAAAASSSSSSSSSRSGGGGSSDRSLALLAALLDLVAVSPTSTLDAALLQLPPVITHLLQRFGVRQALAADWASFVANHTATQVQTALDDPTSPAYEAKRVLALLGPVTPALVASASGSASTSGATAGSVKEAAGETGTTGSTSSAAQLAAALQAPNATEPKEAAAVLTKLVNLLLSQGNANVGIGNEENNADESGNRTIHAASANDEDGAILECGLAETRGNGLTHHEFCAHAPGGGSGGGASNRSPQTILESPDLLSALLTWVERADSPLRHTLLEHLLASSSSSAASSTLESTPLVGLVQKLQVVCALEASKLPSFSHKSSGSDLAESASKEVGLNLKFHHSALAASATGTAGAGGAGAATTGAAADGSASELPEKNAFSPRAAAYASTTTKAPSKKATASTPRSSAAVRATRTSKVADVAAQVLRTVPAHYLPPSYTQACRLLVGTRVRERPARAFARKGNPPSSNKHSSGGGSSGGGSRSRGSSGSDGDWREAIVSAYDENAGAHQLLYLDEDESNNRSYSDDMSGSAAAAAAGSSSGKSSLPSSSTGKRSRRRPNKRHGASTTSSSSSGGGVWVRLALRDVEPLERVRPPQPDPKDSEPKESPNRASSRYDESAAASNAGSPGALAEKEAAAGECKDEMTAMAAEEKTAEEAEDSKAAKKEHLGEGSSFLNAGNACTVAMKNSNTVEVSGAHLAQGRANGTYRPLTLPGYRGCPPWAKVGDSRIAMLR